MLRLATSILVSTMLLTLACKGTPPQSSGTKENEGTTSTLSADERLVQQKLATLDPKMRASAIAYGQRLTTSIVTYMNNREATKRRLTDLTRLVLVGGSFDKALKADPVKASDSLGEFLWLLPRVAAKDPGMVADIHKAVFTRGTGTTVDVQQFLNIGSVGQFTFGLGEAVVGGAMTYFLGMLLANLENTGMPADQSFLIGFVPSIATLAGIGLFVKGVIDMGSAVRNFGSDPALDHSRHGLDQSVELQWQP